MADDAWMDRLAAELEKKAASLDAEYERINRIARRRIGDDRKMLLLQLEAISEKLRALHSRIRSLRTRERK